MWERCSQKTGSGVTGIDHQYHTFNLFAKTHTHKCCGLRGSNFLCAYFGSHVVYAERSLLETYVKLAILRLCKSVELPRAKKYHPSIHPSIRIPGLPRLFISTLFPVFARVHGCPHKSTCPLSSWLFIHFN